MAQIIYAQEALVDLDRIIEFLLQAAPGHASAVIASIQSAVDVLEHHPLIGRRRDSLRRDLVISHGKSGYLALYRYDANEDLVRILRLRHQREAGFLD